MCQVPLEHQQPGQAVECIGIFAVTVVTGWALAHVVAVCWGELVEEMSLLGVGLGLLTGIG